MIVVVGFGAVGICVVLSAIVYALGAVNKSFQESTEALRDLKRVLKGEDEDDIPFVLEEIAAGIRDIAEWHRPDDARPPRPSDAEENPR